MIQESTGKIADTLYALGKPALPAYLLTGKIPILFDAGMTIMGPEYLKGLEEHLGDAHRLAYNFLTHSHFDHSGAAPYLKRKIRMLKTGASRLAADIFKRPNAIQLIQSLSKDLEEKFKSQIGDSDVTFNGLDVDLFMEDGDEVDLGDGCGVQVMATPGHTRDAVSFYIPRLKALVGGEAVGGFDYNFSIRPQFLSSYDDYLASLERLKNLEVNLLLMGHFYVLTGEEAKGHILRSIEATRAFAERIEAELDCLQGNQDEVVKKIFREDYQEKKLIPQEERPFLINLKAQVKAVAERKKV
ncbi:MAG: MBL fold metallo-hydrolase [Thermodesulfobacteriota bacterium]|nr:MBL fold metallo-hydrolase [Thermodesulfobacteriota bacterium]